MAEKTWSDQELVEQILSGEGEAFSLATLPDEEMPDDAIEDVIQRRASTRRFAPRPMPLADLSAIIDRIDATIPDDALREIFLTSEQVRSIRSP